MGVGVVVDFALQSRRLQEYWTLNRAHDPKKQSVGGMFVHLEQLGFGVSHLLTTTICRVLDPTESAS
jgi:hypothetical protein